MYLVPMYLFAIVALCSTPRIAPLDRGCALATSVNGAALDKRAGRTFIRLP